MERYKCAMHAGWDYHLVWVLMGHTIPNADGTSFICLRLRPCRESCGEAKSCSVLQPYTCARDAFLPQKSTVLRQDALERGYVGQYVIWPRHIRAKGQVAPIDPSNRQSQGLRSYKVGEL